MGFCKLLSQIPVSDWSIFCCANLVLKKRTENNKNTNSLIKIKKNAKKVNVNIE